MTSEMISRWNLNPVLISTAAASPTRTSPATTANENIIVFQNAVLNTSSLKVCT